MAPASAPSASARDAILLNAIRAGDMETAADRLVAIANAGPGDVDARLLLAAVYMLMRDPEEATAVYETIVGDDPNHAEAVAMLGILATLWDPVLGSRMLQHAATLAQDDELIQFGAACVFYFAGNANASLATMVEIANSLPGEHPMRRLVIRLLPPDAPVDSPSY
jgi:thioredoxin-like negative regulator of GroEL